jgi:hypothetical protein
MIESLSKLSVTSWDITSITALWEDRGKFAVVTGGSECRCKKSDVMCR